MKSLLLFSLLLLSPTAYGYNAIVRGFESIRAEGMGDVRYTTGLFEENLYGNPARSTENGENEFQFLNTTVEVGSNTFSAASAISKSNENNLSGFAGQVGKPVSAHVQLIPAAFYKNHFWTDKWSFGVDMMVGAQALFEISNAGFIDPMALITAGPTVNLARRLLPEDRLSIGTNLHTEFRGTSGGSLGVLDFLNGTSIPTQIKGGSGMGFDLDLGATFKPHWTFLKCQYEIGGGFNNILGGSYTQLGNRIAGWNKDPLATPRTFNFGVAARRKDLRFFDSYQLALEFTDIGNNAWGSPYRLVHLGTEERWKFIALRAGINQGYFTGGFGFDLKFFELNFATYAEELGLNPGIVSDRRYAANFGFKI